MSEKAQFLLRLPRELYEDVKKTAEEAGVSINDLIVNAIKAYLSGASMPELIELDKVKHVVVAEPRPGQKPPRCYNCGRELKPGWRAVAVPGKGLLCLRCAAKLGVDKQLARYEMEIWRKKRLKREIEKEIQQLYEELTQLETLKKIDVYIKDLNEVARSLRQIMKYDIWDKTKGCSELTELLDEIYEKVNGIYEELKIVETIAGKKLKTKINNMWEGVQL